MSFPINLKIKGILDYTQHFFVFFCLYVFISIVEDCSGFTAGNRIDGVYNISPNKSLTESVPVYCEFSSDGAWTVCIGDVSAKCVHVFILYNHNSELIVVDVLN